MCRIVFQASDNDATGWLLPYLHHVSHSYTVLACHVIVTIVYRFLWIEKQKFQDSSMYAAFSVHV